MKSFDFFHFFSIGADKVPTPCPHLFLIFFKDLTQGADVPTPLVHIFKLYIYIDKYIFTLYPSARRHLRVKHCF